MSPPRVALGKVWLVGAGPGAADLLTLRAARLLEAADIVFHDALVDAETLKLARHARLVDVGKRYGKVSPEQRFIPRAIIEAARTHRTVVRLKGGAAPLHDPRNPYRCGTAARRGPGGDVRWQRIRGPRVPRTRPGAAQRHALTSAPGGERRAAA